MKSKIDIQLELLAEIEEICSQNNLNYVLFEVDGLNPFHTLKNENPGFISIAMTQGDIERFSKIIEENHKSRYVEGTFNNPRYDPIYVSYGNKNTTEIPILELSHKKNYGIEIIIHPINKSVNLDGSRIQADKRLSKEKKIRTTLNKRIENPKFWYIKTGMAVLNGAYSIAGGGKGYYKKLMKNIGIDSWDEIQNYSEVNINEFDINVKKLDDLQAINANGIDIRVPKDTEDFFIKRIENDNREYDNNTIIDTEIGYEEVLNETEDIIKEAKGENEEIAWIKVKAKDEQSTIQKVWQLVEMTNIQVQYIDYFKDKSDKLSKLDLNNKNDFDEVYDELKPVITDLKKYAKMDLTFTVDDKIDRLIEEVLTKKGDNDFLQKIKTLQNKEYLIE